MSPSSHTSSRQAHVLLLLAAAIWGLAFVAQRVGMRYLEPLTFNGVRFGLGALVLLPGIWWTRRRLGGRTRAPLRQVLRGGVIAGVVLFAGTTLQQYGVVLTTAGKAGFITSLYVVLVPVMSLAVGQRVSRMVWLGVAVSLGGLYLLSARGLTCLAPGDGLVLCGAFFWAVHVLVIGRLARECPALELAAMQFLVVSVLSLAGAGVLETPDWSDIKAAAEPILYAGVLSVGVAYTLQVIGQKQAHPAPAALILSLEAVFAAVGGGLLLGEVLSGRALTGCVLMLAGVCLAQLPEMLADNH